MYWTVRGERSVAVFAAMSRWMASGRKADRRTAPNAGAMWMRTMLS